MKFLLINSNPDNAFAAVYNDNELIISYARDFISGEQQRNLLKAPDKLILCFENVSSRSGDLNDIDAISVTTGPGSFTGIRVGLAIAKGVAGALGKKIIPVNNFELCLNRVKNHSPDTAYCVLIPSKIPEYYYSVFKNNKQLETGLIQIGELRSKLNKSTVIVGNFSDDSEKKDNYFKYINIKELIPEVDSMVELSLKKFRSSLYYNPIEVEPVYIKDFIIRKNTKG